MIFVGDVPQLYLLPYVPAAVPATVEYHSSDGVALRTPHFLFSAETSIFFNLVPAAARTGFFDLPSIPLCCCKAAAVLPALWS